MGDLVSFASATNRSQKGGACWTCGIPERDEIDAAHRDQQIGARTICDWLIAEKGYTDDEIAVRHHSIKAHFSNRHHERAR